VGLRLIILGPPGAGKGTQALKITHAFEIPHISTGAILREEINRETMLGLAVQAQIEAGNLAPDDLVCKIVDKRLAKPDCGDGYMLDGFPRTRCQAERFDKMLQERGENLNLVLDIVVEDDVIVKRLSARRMCPNCGAIYNLLFKLPKKMMRCDNPACDGAELFQRADDSEEAIRQRLKVYHAETEPVRAFYEAQGKLKVIAGDSGSPDEVFAKIEYLIAANDVTCSQ